MDTKILRADELGLQLGIVHGLSSWEPHPIYKHQKAVDRIRTTIEKEVVSAESGDSVCDCVHAADVYVSFPDGSLKRPDISMI